MRHGPATMGARFYRVRELVGYLHELFAADPVLADVWVAGEIADLTRSAAGHIYFLIRDQDARLPAVMFRSAAQRQTLPLLPGYQALVHGSVSLYDARSTVQIVADIVLPGDAGRLQAEFEALRRRLEDEGLFAPERKRTLPRFPRRIGIVTSEGGAVIHDMLNVWSRRYRDLELVFAPSAVQGDEAPAQVVAALDRLHEYHLARAPLDLVIVARGGGSPEELAAFNDERVARAVYACPVPVVSAVGHEVDVTIADLVADLRAPTPSAAAEMVVPDESELRRDIDHLVGRLGAAAQRQHDARRQELAHLTTRLARHTPERLLADHRREIDTLMARAGRAIDNLLAWLRARVAAATAELDALSPLATLQRGFAVATRDSDGRVLVSATDVDLDTSFTVRLAQGAVRGRAVAHVPIPHAAAAARKEEADGVT